MASNGMVDPVAVQSTTGKSKKHKKRKNKLAHAKLNGDIHAIDAAESIHETENGVADDEPDSPQVESNEEGPEQTPQLNEQETNDNIQSLPNGHDDAPNGEPHETSEGSFSAVIQDGHNPSTHVSVAQSPENREELLSAANQNGHDPSADTTTTSISSTRPDFRDHETSEATTNGVEYISRDAVEDITTQPTADTEQRLESAAKERDQLRAEVTELRKSLEGIKQRHEDEVASISALHEEETSGFNARLGETQSSKDHAEAQYHKLLGKVNTIKTQLGERLKADAADLSQARTRIEELEEQNKAFEEQQKTIIDSNESLQSRIFDLNSSKEAQGQEISNLRFRANLSQQNWAKERDDLNIREAQAREEFESAKQAMQDWEVLAMEERSIREGLSDRVAEVEEQLSNQREAYERAASERDTQSVTVDGLQRALQDIQEARRLELREMVENSQMQIEEIRRQLKTAEEASTSSQNALETARQELERVMPFEKEVKEKNLLIGKLRHEAVILNDHLTKALRFLKKGKPEDTVDRQLVTNHLLHFLALDRSDPKKFQVLQLISALLNWNDEQNEAAGLARPGASSQPMNPNNSLRLPLSPLIRRVSSTASLNPTMSLNSIFTSAPALASTPELGVDSPSGKESLAELWSGFLEREAQEGIHSRQTSVGTSLGRREGLVSPTAGPGSPRFDLSREPSRSGSFSGQGQEPGR